jgi:Ni/Co efflux regulator RcnB
VAVKFSPRRKGNEVMKKSLLSALGLAFALAVSLPIIGASSADAAPMAKKHHHHHHHHKHHKKHHRHHHHHHHKKVEAKKA